MYFFYIDESGSPEQHHSPLVSGETPIFCLSSICIREDDWRSLDRDYLKLKNRFFSYEIGTNRPEYFEVKGSELTRPGNRSNRRNQQFIKQVLNLSTNYNAKLFSVIFIKDTKKPIPKKSLYTMALQYLCERFQIFLEEREDKTNGLMIMDSRMRNIDIEVAKSHMSFIFGHSTGKTCDKILEAPMFADSSLTVGLQITDIISSCIYTNYYQRNCMFIPCALDYSHMLSYWQTLLNLEFKSKQMHDGFIKNGFRIIDFSD